jgi:hypothetical protein
VHMSLMLSVLQPEGMAGSVMKGVGGKTVSQPNLLRSSNSLKGSSVRCESVSAHLWQSLPESHAHHLVPTCSGEGGGGPQINT